MSKEGLQKFAWFLAENKEAAAKAAELGGDIEAIVAYGQELGYEFDPEEFKEYQRQVVHLFKDRIEKKLNQPTPQENPGVEQLKRFMLLAETDENMTKRLKELSFSNQEAFIAYGKEQGFIFTADDMESFAREIMGQSDELSDEELEIAAGGTVVGIAVVAAMTAAAVTLGVGVAGALAGGLVVAFSLAVLQKKE